MAKKAKDTKRALTQKLGKLNSVINEIINELEKQRKNLSLSEIVLLVELKIVKAHSKKLRKTFRENNHV